MEAGLDLTYYVAPSGTGHIERPPHGWTKGSHIGLMVLAAKRSEHGRLTYCGRPLADSWPTTTTPNRPCGTCVRAEFADEDE